MELMKIFCFLFLLAITDTMPITSTTPKAHDLGYLDWDTQIRICGADIIDYMESVLCKKKYPEYDNNEHGLSRTESDFQELSVKCCEIYCTSKAIRAFCVNNSTTTPRPTTTTARITVEPQRADTSILFKVLAPFQYMWGLGFIPMPKYM